MAFLDNSGDIILDAVLTDTGRFRMARGDFRISKFALGDDEIDYSLYNKNHPSGSAYYDLEVLKTPILEAFTNNTSTMKSKLVSISRTNILHMPVMRLLNGGNASAINLGANEDLVRNSAVNTKTGGFVVLVDKDTNNLATNEIKALGIIKNDDNEGVVLADQPNHVVIERGLDTNKIAPAVPMPATLQETQFIFEMDHRLGSLVTIGAEAVPVSFIDDDQIASYYVSNNAAIVRAPVDRHPVTAAGNGENQISAHNIKGPRDRIIVFKVRPSVNLATSTYLFEKLGTIHTQTANQEIPGLLAQNNTYYVIDTSVRITSATTAYSIEVPIRYMKKKT